jgi:hypothetical protein
VARGLARQDDPIAAGIVISRARTRLVTPWQIGEVEETELLMGPDYHAHGLEKNRDTVDAFCQSAFDDGLTERRVTVDEYFAEFLSS